MKYSNHIIPLESNPELFTELVHRVGVSLSLSFHDVLSLDDPELIAFLPRPVLALALVFPTSPDYETKLAERDPNAPDYAMAGGEEEVVWYRHAINNSCGLYAILHAISNGAARNFLLPSSHISTLLNQLGRQSVADRAAIIETDDKLEETYKVVASNGDSALPGSAEDEVNFHYVCFVKSHNNGYLYEIDGDRNSPVDWGLMTENDVF